MSNTPGMNHVAFDWADRLVILGAVAAFGTLAVCLWLIHRLAIPKRVGTRGFFYTKQTLMAQK